MDIARLERLAAGGFQILPLPGVSTHFAIERDGFVALAPRREDDFGEPGAPGLLTEAGFAAMIWRGPEAWFVARGFERLAEVGEVEGIRRFDADLKQALAR